MKSENLYIVCRSNNRSHSYEKTLMIVHSDLIDILCLRINSNKEITDEIRLQVVKQETETIINKYFNGITVKNVRPIIGSSFLIFLVELDGWPENKPHTNNPYAFIDRMHITKTTEICHKIINFIDNYQTNLDLVETSSTV